MLMWLIRPWFSPASSTESSSQSQPKREPARPPRSRVAEPAGRTGRGTVAAPDRSEEGEGGDEGGARALIADRGDEGRSAGVLAGARTAATPSIASSIVRRVVVGAADDVDEDQRVEGDEGGGAQRVDAAPGGEAGDEQRPAPSTESAATAFSTADRGRDRAARRAGRSRG